MAILPDIDRRAFLNAARIASLRSEIVVAMAMDDGAREGEIRMSLHGLLDADLDLVAERVRIALSGQ